MLLSLESSQTTSCWVHDFLKDFLGVIARLIPPVFIGFLFLSVSLSTDPLPADIEISLVLSISIVFISLLCLGDGAKILVALMFFLGFLIRPAPKMLLLFRLEGVSPPPAKDCPPDKLLPRLGSGGSTSTEMVTLFAANELNYWKLV